MLNSLKIGLIVLLIEGLFVQCNSSASNEKGISKDYKRICKFKGAAFNFNSNQGHKNSIHAEIENEDNQKILRNIYNTVYSDTWIFEQIFQRNYKKGIQRHWAVYKYDLQINVALINGVTHLAFFVTDLDTDKIVLKTNNKEERFTFIKSEAFNISEDGYYLKEFKKIQKRILSDYD